MSLWESLRGYLAKEAGRELPLRSSGEGLLGCLLARRSQPGSPQSPAPGAGLSMVQNPSPSGSPMDLSLLLCQDSPSLHCLPDDPLTMR